MLVNKGGHGSASSFRLETNAAEKKGGMELRVEAVMRQEVHGSHEGFEKRELKKRQEALVLTGGVLDTEGLDDDLQELFRYKDDGTGEVHRWINDVQSNFFRGPAKECKDGWLGE